MARTSAPSSFRCNGCGSYKIWCVRPRGAGPTPQVLLSELDELLGLAGISAGELPPVRTYTHHSAF